MDIVKAIFYGGRAFQGFLCYYVHDHVVFREKEIHSLVAEDNLVWMGF
jgi:hypothetical protein